MKLRLITLFFISSVFVLQAQEKESASSILEKAYSQAKAENKTVFVKYSASWCGWCKRMDKHMKSDDCKAFFDDNYVTVTLVVKESGKNKHLEHPEGSEYLKKHKGEKSGLPFWVILDTNGKVIEDSYDTNGDNLGCPATETEINEFIKILKKTSKLTDKDLEIIAKTFSTKP